MNKLRAIRRGFYIIFLTLWYLTPLLVVSAIRGYNLERSLQVRRRWARKVIKAAGIVLKKKGNPPLESNYLYVSNHRSYFDPIIVLTEALALPVAKAEVSKWPLVGFAAKATGIHFVQRDSRNSRRDTVMAMADTIKKGVSILIYPEGTTSDGPATIDFRRGGFSMAASQGISVAPICIEYRDEGDAWAGDESFLTHFLACFAKKRTYVKISYGKELSDTSGQGLMEKTKRWIDEELLQLRQDLGVKS